MAAQSEEVNANVEGEEEQQGESWDDWTEEQAPATCLLCPVVSPSVDETLLHMSAVHGFNLSSAVKEARE